MKIELRKLTLTYFKGIKSFTVNLSQYTNIFGYNETGKSTLVDGFLWLLFGKDSSDSKDFSIKTLDENNQPLHKLDHEVTGQLFIDGIELNLRRVYKEKWTTKRGSSAQEFTGHEQQFFWNDVPLKESEYKAKIDSLINEKTFKLVTSPTYFNSKEFSWQDRRGVLLQMAGDIDSGEVLGRILTKDNKEKVDLLSAALNQNKSIKEFKDEINAKKKKLKDELKLLPARIDEANRSLPEEKDFTAIEGQIKAVTGDLDTIESMLSNKSKAHKQHQEAMSKKINEVHELNQRLQNIEFEEKNRSQDKRRSREQAIVEKKSELRIKQSELDRTRIEFNNEKNRKTDFDSRISDLRKDWGLINAETLVFDEKEFTCPACKRAYETSDIEAKKSELITNFNSSKAERLKAIDERGKKIVSDNKTIDAALTVLESKGKGLSSEVSVLQNQIANLEQEHTILSDNETEALKEAISENTEYQGLVEMIRLRNEEINTPFQENNSALLMRKKDLSTQLDGLKASIATKGERQRIQTRIDELKANESTMAEELANLEGVEFAMEQYDKALMDILESRVNGRFKMVKFKMFEEQINGGQAPCCTTLIKGVPYPDANTAGKIYGGLDIIKALNEFYDVYAPIFIDNRESVINIPDMDCQIINLIVSEKDKKLRVEAGQPKMAFA